MPKFSVLMANYNNGAYIDEAIRSVLAQTFSDWELVIIDDASRDNSVERINRYLSDPRIRLFARDRNEGYTQALIFGLSKASSEIVGVLDSDDALAPNAVERVLTIHTQKPEVGLVLSQVVYCDAHLVPVETTVAKPEHEGEPLVWMRGPNAFRTFKLAAYNKTAGLDTSIRHAEDWDLVFKLEEVAPVYRIDEPLYLYRVLRSSASNAPWFQVMGIRSTVLALYKAYLRRGRARSNIPRPALLRGLAAAVRHSLELHHPAQAVHFALRALRVAPLERASWRALAKALEAAVRHPVATRVVPGSVDATGWATLRSYAVRGLQSKTGNIEVDHVLCIPLVHKRGHCIFGGNYSISEDGIYSAVFEMEIGPYEFASDPLVMLDVYENLRTKVVLAERAIGKAEVAGSPRFFSVEFPGKVGQCVEFRAFWREQSDLKVYGVVLKHRAASDDAAASSGLPAPRLSPVRPVQSVSAIIPCYNGAPWLAEAITSIQSQTRAVDEIIVVDDCSTDGSYEIATEHNAIVIRNPSNSGEGFSRNVGLKHARGDFIAWLDADDMWMPHHVQTLATLLEKHPEATGAFAAVQAFGLRHNLIRGYVPLGEPSNVFWLAFGDWLHTTIGSMVSRTALLGIGGFDEQERYSVDFDLWLRLSRSHLFVCTHEPTSYWRWHDAQQSVNQEKQIAALYRFRRKYWEQEQARGDPDFAAALECRMAEIWQGELTAALNIGDEARFRFLSELAPLLPKVPSNRPPEWPGQPPRVVQVER